MITGCAVPAVGPADRDDPEVVSIDYVAAPFEPSPVRDDIDLAVERGIDAVASSSDENIVVLLLMDVMHRRFGIEAFGAAAAEYDAHLAGDFEPPIDAIAFRRVIDASQTLSSSEIDAVSPGVNQITVPALYCDQVALRPAYAALLAEQAEVGGYPLTHALMALYWIEELGCAAPVDAAHRDQMVRDVLELPDPSDGVDDLEIEAWAFAVLAAGPAALPEEALAVTLDAQLPDGSWPRRAGDTIGAWHATAIALLLALELTRPPIGPFLP